MSELTTTSWLILADDLTGAADAAVPFAQRSLDSRVLCAPGPLTNHSEAQVIACNVESRTASREEAIRLNRLALAQHSQTDRRLFKKIDSLFRGHPAEEIAVALDQQSKDGARAFGILAPAFPATGRTTVNGQVHVYGRPLDLTGGSQHRLNRNNVDLIELLSRAELSAAVVPLEVVRDSESLAQTLERLRSEGHDVAICDATEQSDLQCIARAGVEFEDAVLIGSAGLASAIAALLPNGSAIGTRIQKTRPVLTVIGSQASESHRSAQRLIQDTGLHSVSVDVQLLEDPQARRTLEALVDDAAGELRAQHDVLIYLTETKELPLSIRAEVAQNLAAMLTPLFPLAGSLVASGGDTAAALLVRAGVQSIRLLDEMDPGVCLGLTMGDLCIPIVTKSGSFGGDESLVRIVRHLHALEAGGPR